MFYGAAVWDPWLIIAQMALLQCGFYLLLGAWLVLLSQVYGVVPQLRLLLSARVMAAGDDPAGYVPVGAFVLSFVPCAVLVAAVVHRARKCLDFVATIYFYHTLLSWAYDGFPAYWEWWLLHTCCLAATTVLSEYLCIRREMLDIPREAMELQTSPPGGKKTAFPPI